MQCTKKNCNILGVSDLRQFDGFLRVSSTNKTDDRTEILLKVALNAINQSSHILG